MSDKFYLGSGNYYFGERNADYTNMLTKHGRGIYHYESQGKEGGCSYVGQFMNDKFFGICDVIYDNGKKKKAQYENGEIIKWLKF